MIAGATAPTGSNNDIGTSPQRFARELKTMVTLRSSTPTRTIPTRSEARKDIAPEAMPHYPQLTVSLGNISTLLKIFPSKPFYISEYGYYTGLPIAMGIYVNQVTQATSCRAPTLTRPASRRSRRCLVPYQDNGPPIRRPTTGAATRVW